MIAPALRLPLRIVLYRDGTTVFAHALELDLLGHGSSQAEALDQLARAIQVQFEASRDFGDWDGFFRPAEGRYFRMFAEGRDVSVGTPAAFDLPAPFVIEGVSIRAHDAASAAIA